MNEPKYNPFPHGAHRSGLIATLAGGGMLAAAMGLGLLGQKRALMAPPTITAMEYCQKLGELFREEANAYEEGSALRARLRTDADINDALTAWLEKNPRYAVHEYAREFARLHREIGRSLENRALADECEAAARLHYRMSAWVETETARRTAEANKLAEAEREQEQKRAEELKKLREATRKDGFVGSGVCSFCGKKEAEVDKLIAGPSNVYICNECTGLCAEIVAEAGAVDPKPEPSPFLVRCVAPKTVDDMLEEAAKACDAEADRADARAIRRRAQGLPPASHPDARDPELAEYIGEQRAAAWCAKAVRRLKSGGDAPNPTTKPREEG